MLRRTRPPRGLFDGSASGLEGRASYHSIVPHSKDRLERYRRKRSPDRTPEPYGGGAVRPGFFVVQQHHARRLHYDLRLEVDGVLRSWAVPKGPSLDPADKRLAVETEDHPIEYGDFEGIIPAGNYGAGAVIIWDRGRAVHDIEPSQGIDEGKLLFTLYGFKLRGLWTLVRTKRNPKEWLLIKKPDAAADGRTVDELPAGSVLSGLTAEELGEGSETREQLLATLDELGPRRRALSLDGLKPMLATLEHEPFSRRGWLFEPKLDGYRLLSAKRRDEEDGDEVRLMFRSGLDATRRFPELLLALEHLPYRHLVLDGEVTVLGDDGLPTFGRLQRRAGLSRTTDVERAAVESPAVYWIFDLLACEGFDLRPLPLHERKALLERLLPAAGPLRYVEHVADRGREFYDSAKALGLEGMVGKRGDSRYTGGRSRSWIKVRADRADEFVIVGYTLPSGSRSGFGALHLALYEDQALRYVGRVGTGFSDRQLGEIRASLDAIRVDEPPAEGDLPHGRQHRWTAPRLVAEVRYSDLTDGGQLRHPVFLRLRADKRASECRSDAPPAEAPATEDDPVAARAPVEITRPGKIFWPAEGYTKGDLIAYYRSVSPWILPYLENRPLVLDRYPDGIEGKSFFQKNAPEFAPDWLRTEAVWTEESGKETRYFVCDDEETLTYLINSGAIPLHLWSSRIDDLQHPDWAILDLDAKQCDFADVVRVARAIHALCRDLDLPSYVKTSGASGLHVLLPLGRQCTHDQARQLAELLARCVVRENASIASVARTPKLREGKVYVDFLQNGHGKLLVSPFTVRPLPGAPVSTPLRWREVDSRLDKSRFHIGSIPKRLRRLQSDPFAGLLTAKPPLLTILERLTRRVA